MGTGLRAGSRYTFRKSICMRFGGEKIRFGAGASQTVPEDGGGDAARPTGRHASCGDLREGVRVPSMELLEHGEGATFDSGFIEGWVEFFFR